MGMRVSLPIDRLTLLTVRGALVTACRLAASPTRRSPALVNATTEGVVRWPSALGITTGLPPSMTAAQLLVVPRSIPMIFAIVRFSFQRKRPDSERASHRSRCGRDSRPAYVWDCARVDLDFIVARQWVKCVAIS